MTHQTETTLSNLPTLLGSLAESMLAEITRSRDLVSRLPAGFEKQFDDWNQAVAKTITVLEQQADVIGLPHSEMTWSDSATFQHLVEKLIAKQSEPLRLPWKQLSEQLQRGSFQHPIPRKQQQLEALRKKSIAETTGLGDETRPPILPGFAATVDWLSWALGENQHDLQSLVEQLEGPAPSLANLLEEADVSRWQSEGLSANGFEQAIPDRKVETIPEAGETATFEQSSVSNTRASEEASRIPEEVAPDEPQHSDQSERVANDPNLECEATPLLSARPDSQLRTEILGFDAETVVPHSVPELVQLGDRLPSWPEFQKRNWIDPLTGNCEVAPWANIPEFCEALQKKLIDCLKSGLQDQPDQFGEAWLYAKSLEELGNPWIGSQTIMDFVAVWNEPLKGSVGRNSARATVIRDAVDGTCKVDEADVRLMLVLEALRPSPDEMLWGDELSRVMKHASFKNDHLSEVIRRLLIYHTQSASDPLAQLRSSLKRATPEPVDYEGRLKKQKEELRLKIVGVRLSAGSPYVGRFKHCKEAWDIFFQDHLILGLKEMISPELLVWDHTAKSKWVATLSKTFAMIADRGNCREKSRKMMDRAVERLLDLIREVNETSREVLRLSQPQAETIDEWSHEAERLVDCSAFDQFDEELGRRLVRLCLRPEAERPVAVGTLMRVNPEVFCRCSELLRLLTGPVNPDKLDDDSAQTTFDELLPAHRAAGLLLQTAERKTIAQYQKLEDELRRHRKFELLAVWQGQLPDIDKQSAMQASADAMIASRRGAEACRKLWRDLEEMSFPEHTKVAAILKEAKDDLEGPGELGHPPSLLIAWHQSTACELERLRDEVRQQWRSLIESEGGPNRDVRLRELEDGHLVGVTKPQQRSSEPNQRGWRETTSRAASRKQFLSTSQTLRDESAGNAAVEQWCKDNTRHQDRLRLLKKFVIWTFGGERPESLYSRSKEQNQQPNTTAFTIETKLLRDHLAGQQPVFVPQLQLPSVRSFVVLAPPVSVTDPDFVQRALNVCNQFITNAIVVLLCPQVTRAVRSQLIEEMQERGAFAAVLDDLDLCRLLKNPAGVRPNPILGLMEIVLEQQVWSARNPFAAPEGNEMRLEMYVGRRSEAEAIATTGEFTRLFSGRKLGKTALLQFVRQTWNGRELANRRTLRVIYVGIAGVRRENLFIKKVLDQLRTEFANDVVEITDHDSEQFVEALHLLLKRQPKVDLLIVLDEADEFVLAQLEEYEKFREACLSFQLRSEPFGIGAEKRVRFVFTGYRATATYEGAWANWGDVLRLEPLSEVEAAILIGRPLARFGIDATQHADIIAFRCGYQPAVLLKFGSQLIHRLSARGFREDPKITDEDVSETFQEFEVQDEIRRVVRANFQGNQFGHAVFVVVLDELSRRPQGYGLSKQEAVARVLETFHQQCNDATRWLPDNQNTRKLLEDQFRDLLKRGLLVEVSREAGRAREYRLKCPHHLPLLRADVSLHSEITTNLHAWFDSPSDVNHVDRHRMGELRGPLHRDDLSEVADMVRPENRDLAPRIITVGSLWPECADTETGGLADRLGIDPNRVAVLNLDCIPDFDSQTGLWSRVSAKSFEKYLSADVQHHRPILLAGGVDLIRASIRAKRERKIDIETFGPFRLSDGWVRWWFNRIRAVELPVESQFDEIFKLTYGIPLLIGRFDRCLLPEGSVPGGFNPNAKDFEGVRSRFEEEIQRSTFGLDDEHRPTTYLTPRERELVRMVCVISEILCASDSQDDVRDYMISGVWQPTDFEDGWNHRFPNHLFPTPFLEILDDSIALDTLLKSGILRSRVPRDLDGQVLPFVAEDPIPRIWMRLR